jgi:two-component system NtrC family sensor kinase
LITDLMVNEQKINQHGKRADGIVKGMLEHSRSSTGRKEPTDLNKLVDKYLTLAYRGLQAKDKSFSAELVTSFDESLPPANIIPQDIGRVLLNLFNNAFYAVQQKQQMAGPDYRPTIEVTTSYDEKRLQINVWDNGTGIPDGVKEKIMQPFFTTKPTGQGTGLGLSLSYDIVVKGHGGRLTATSKEKEFTQFDISIPV